MALTLSGTNGVVGAGFTLDASGASVTAGVGTFGSLNAPAAGLTGALPAISAASLTQIPAANIVGVATAGFGNASGAYTQGITEVDEWRINTSYSASGTNTLSANWERNDSNFQLIGTGLSESSGVFTFPSTGKYYISFKTTAYGSSSTQYAGVEIMVSNDGSSYVNYAESFDSIEGSSNYYSSSGIELVLDVTNTSNFKFYFRMSSNQTVNFYGHTQRMATGFTCIRLGDT